MKGRSKVEKEVVHKKYVAGRKMTIAGVSYKPGDESDLDGVRDEYIAYLLGRQMWGVVDGLESLSDEMFLMVKEETD